MNEVWAADEVWGVDRVWPVNATNITRDDYLLQQRGPKHLPLSVVVPITLVYAAIFLSGVLGNIATCVVIVTNNSLHTPTNYYLFSLAVSDVTLLLLGLLLLHILLQHFQRDAGVKKLLFKLFYVLLILSRSNKF